MSLWKGQQATPIAFASIAGVLLLAASRALSRSASSKQLILRAPQPTEREPYPWNLYDGGATLQTPYGGLRLYEMGPKEGKKVLLIHGISQPCPVWREVIPQLVEAGHRVLCYDIVGRGYSDGPADITYNMTLFISQLCFLLASLPEWSGSFDLIGFSMGGAIATTFASYFPHRIDSLLLIAPSGLIQTKKLPWLLRAFLSDLIPLSLTSSLIFNGIIPIKFLHVTDMVDWQIKNHKGYIHSYTSTLTSGSFTDLQELFQETQEQFGDRMQAIWGDEDPVCPMDDARIISGLKVHVVKGGRHDMLLKPQFKERIGRLMVEFLASS